MAQRLGENEERLNASTSLHSNERPAGRFHMSEFGDIFGRIFQDSPDVVWIASASVDRLVYINSTIEEWLTIDREALIEDPSAHFPAVHHEDRDERKAFFSRLGDASASLSEDTRTTTYRLWDSNGQLRHLEERVHPITDTSHAVVYWVGVTRDVTETHTYVQTLEMQSKQYRLLNQIIRHDIRNEMNLGIDLLRTITSKLETPPEEIETLRSVLDQIIDLTETSRDMTDVIAEFAGDATTVPLQACIQREVANLSMTAEDLTITVEDAIPPVSVRSTELLPAVFRNLFSNVVQHTDTSSPEIRISITQSRERVVVHIADNGPGIDDRHKERIFESGETVSGDGTGFGLSLVETLLAQHNGGIYVMDNEPTGSVFAVSLPLAE